jgi:hypothetical protein
VLDHRHRYVAESAPQYVGLVTRTIAFASTAR